MEINFILPSHYALTKYTIVLTVRMYNWKFIKQCPTFTACKIIERKYLLLAHIILITKQIKTDES